MRKQPIQRWVILSLAIFGLLGLLLYRLYDLNVVQGDHFLALAETRRTKEIQIPAPRGNIYDRNGVLLAGSRTSFAVQGTKDEAMKLEKKDRTSYLASIIRFVERDGADTISDFPIERNCIVYQSDADYLKEPTSPLEKAQQLLIQNDLVDDWLGRVYVSASDPDYRVSPAARALNALSLKGSALPITAEADQNFALSFVEGEDLHALQESGAVDDSATPLSFLAQKVSGNTNIFMQTLSHPAAQELAYRLLDEHKLSGNLKLADAVYTNEEEFRIRKAALHRTFPAITLETTAQEDFVTIVRQAALDAFLESIDVSSENRFYIPAEQLINALQSKGIETNLSYTIASDAKSVSIVYDTNEETDELPIDRLKKVAIEENLIDDLIVDANYKNLAENAMFAQGIYPGISTSTWTYGFEKNQKDFLEGHDLEQESPTEAFDQLVESYGIAPETDPVLAQGVMMLTDRIAQPGNYAFWPVNLIYELSEDTVAKIEETIPASSGLAVSQQPVRYYPYGESAAHVLGYIGKIATDEEIETYVTHGNYLPNELIGKTGIEQSFEDTLHGVSGTETVLVDVRGNRTETLSRKEPKAGNNVYLTIDINLQQQSEKSVHDAIVATKYGMNYRSPWGTNGVRYSPMANSGANVAVDPNNGEVLAMTSYPMFDPNLFVTGISKSDWSYYQYDTTRNPDAPKPLYNLATQASIQPGSVFKTVVALAALDKGLDPDKTILDRGFVRVGNRQFNNLYYTNTGQTEGPLTLYDAIGWSNNYYFYILGLGRVPATGEEIDVQVTVDDIEKTAKRLGLSEATGIEIKQPSESPNHVPSRESKTELSRALLKQFLVANLQKYEKKDVKKNAAAREADRETILAWSEQGADVNRTKLIDDLDALGYEAETALEGERAGLADILKFTYFNQSDWTVADSMNVVIGQGQNAYTPISIASLASTLANRGTDYTFTLIREVRSADNKTVLFTQKPVGRDVDFAKEDFDAVREGMRRSAIHSEDGFKGIPFAIGSKTGTAERGGVDPRTGSRYASYAWNIAFAPFDEPKIATVSFMPAGMMSSNVVPISRDVIASYLDLPAQQDVPEGLYETRPTYNPDVEELPEPESSESSEEASGEKSVESTSAVEAEGNIE
ncbi:MAG: penicillin-binding transpeptidase domain-containing protein [Peptoniphilaceae bacterium]|nr:penicillin-binding transpeptidase domain-containing protein [Peptoniphilaceae bacterium]